MHVKTVYVPGSFFKSLGMRLNTDLSFRIALAEQAKIDVLGYSRTHNRLIQIARDEYMHYFLFPVSQPTKQVI